MGFDFQSHGRTFSQVTDFIFDGLQEVAGFFLVDVKVAIARNPESPGTEDIEAGEETVDEEFDDQTQQGKRALGAGP